MESGMNAHVEQHSDQPAALTLAQLADGLELRGDHFALHGAAGWLQGRTMYGGASSFIAFCAAARAFPDLPPLRAAQIGFIGPVGEDIEARVTMLRTGKSVSHVETSLTCAGALVHRATWQFGQARAGNGQHPADRIDSFVPPEDCATVTARQMVPAFVDRMDLRYAGVPDGRPAVVRRWVRLRERAGIDPLAELIAMGDALPPGSMRAMERPGPISSINWSLTLLGDAITTRDGWWLLETASNHMADGFSSETLRAWNTEGVEVMRGLQAVAIFG
jgi:acyl-CoA thioesterase